jgi:FKBP-type peptidyl-prolyl cis-trans isomerase 2
LGDGLKEGDFIRIDYVGRVSGTDEIFDLTREDVAKERGIYNPKFKYGSIPVIIGARHVVKGLEEGLKKMKVGERKRIVVKPENAFGIRSPKLIKLIPLSVFRKQRIDPFPGMPITYRNIRGRVLSVSGGRVKVDFNHPLAGKTLEYDVEIKELITGKRDKVKAILELLLNIDKKDVDVRIEKETVEIKIKRKEDTPKLVKKSIANTITKWVKSIKKVKFVEEY